MLPFQGYFRFRYFATPIWGEEWEGHSGSHFNGAPMSISWMKFWVNKICIVYFWNRQWDLRIMLLSGLYGRSLNSQNLTDDASITYELSILIFLLFYISCTGVWNLSHLIGWAVFEAIGVIVTTFTCIKVNIGCF